MKLLTKTIESPASRLARKRTRFPGAAELERLLLLDVTVIAVLLLFLVIFRSL